MAESGGTVLVTGGTGFLGGWCGAELVRRGYAVRTTVRDLRRADDVRAAFAAAGVDGGDRLSVVAADLGADDGWDDAVAGCDYVLHVASPFPPAQPKDPDELIIPARDGALRVLRASLDAGVQRVVMTSSVAAVRHGREPSASAPYNEQDWTDPDDLRRTPYVRSKTIAERAAWDLAAEMDATERLATVNPGAILGPVSGPDRSPSLEVVQRLLNGMPGTPRIGFNLVDVRDVADLQIRAMTDPAAGGRRLLAVRSFEWMAEVAEVLRDCLGDEAPKVPKRSVPDLMVRAMGLFDPGIRSVTSQLGRRQEYSSAAAESLGWAPRPIDQTIVDCARSMLGEAGVEEPP
jgi:dihydroflavonol-4-reductase